MRSRLAVSLIISFLIFVPLGSQAAGLNQSSQYKVSVPFDFMIGRYMFPAGLYTLQRTSQQTFLLRACHGSAAMVINTRPVHRQPKAKPAMLVFDRRQHHYQLLQFWTDSANGQKLMDRPLPQTQQPQLRTVAFTR